MFKVGHLFCCVLIVHACSPGVDVVSGENQEDLVRRSVGNFPPPPPPPPPGGKNGERGGSSGNPGRGTVTSPALSGGKNDGLVGSSGDPESGAITNPVPLLPPPGGNSGGKSDGLVGSSGDPRGEAVTNPVPPLPPPGGNSGGKSDGRVGSSGHPRGGTVTSLVLSGESDGSGGRTEASSPADEARGATESIVDKEKEENERKKEEARREEVWSKLRNKIYKDFNLKMSARAPYTVSKKGKVLNCEDESKLETLEKDLCTEDASGKLSTICGVVVGGGLFDEGVLKEVVAALRLAIGEEKDRKRAKKEEEKRREARKKELIALKEKSSEELKKKIEECHNQLPEALKESCTVASCHIQTSIEDEDEDGIWTGSQKKVEEIEEKLEKLQKKVKERKKELKELQNEIQNACEAYRNAEAWKATLEEDTKALDKKYEEVPQESDGAKRYMFNTSAIKQVESFLTDWDEEIEDAWKKAAYVALMYDGHCKQKDLDASKVRYEKAKKMRKELQKVVESIDAATEASETVGSSFLSSISDALKCDVERLIKMKDWEDSFWKGEDMKLDPEVWRNDIVNTEDSREQWEKQDKLLEELRQSVKERVSCEWGKYWNKCNAAKKRELEPSLTAMAEALVSMVKNLGEFGNDNKLMPSYGDPRLVGGMGWQGIVINSEILDQHGKDADDLLKSVLAWFGIKNDEGKIESLGMFHMESYLDALKGCVEFDAISRSLKKFRTSMWILFMGGEVELLALNSLKK